MGETPFQTFIGLVALDQSINVLNKELASFDVQKNQIAKQTDQLAIELEAIKQRVHEMQKNVDVQELEMKTLDDQEKSKKHRLENLSSHKDYQSLKSEIDFLKKQQHALEDTLIQAWHALETAKKEYAQKQHEYDEKIKSFDVQLKNIEEKKKAQQLEYEAHVAQREPVQAKVPQEWMDKNVAMRTRVVDPVVPVTQGICSACYYQVSEQDMIALNHRRIVQCKDCFRLLYLPQAQEKSVG